MPVLHHSVLGEEYRELSYLIIATFFWGVFLQICVKIVLSVCADAAANLHL